MRLLFLVVCLAGGGVRAQIVAPAALEQLEAASHGAGDGRWADGTRAKPSVVAAAGMPSSLAVSRNPAVKPPASPIVEPPPFDDGNDGIFLGMGEGFMSVERAAFAVRRVAYVGMPLAAVLFVVLLVPALIFGLINAVLTA